MSDHIAALLIVALFVDAAANIFRLMGVEIAYHRQEALIDRQAEEQKLDREARKQIAKDIISETVKATLGELYEMSEDDKPEADR